MKANAEAATVEADWGSCTFGLIGTVKNQGGNAPIPNGLTGTPNPPWLLPLPVLLALLIFPAPAFPFPAPNGFGGFSVGSWTPPWFPPWLPSPVPWLLLLLLTFGTFWVKTEITFLYSLLASVARSEPRTVMWEQKSCKDTEENERKDIQKIQ